jgi:hypothetical protein
MTLTAMLMPKIATWATMLAVLAHPLLAAHCPCCEAGVVSSSKHLIERMQSHHGPHCFCAREQSSECGRNDKLAREEQPPGHDHGRTDTSPCSCPEHCPCHLRHGSAALVNDRANAVDLSERAAASAYHTVSPPTPERLSLQHAITRDWLFILYRSASDLCALICRFTI